MLITAVAACGLVYLAAPDPIAGAAGFACICLMPGLALHFISGGASLKTEGHVLLLGLSPVLSGVTVTLLLLWGLALPEATRFSCFLFALAAMTGIFASGRRAGLTVEGTGPGPTESGVPTRVWIIAILAVGALSVFPQLGEVSRMRSDAWFHSAIVSELMDFGLPPTDPYFAGMPLQYMWLYHVYVGALSLATGLQPSWAMAVVNLQALACLVIVTYAVARALGGDRPGSAAAPAFMLTGLNCLFWAFLPVKMARAVVGEVTGWAEVARQLSFLPLGTEKARAFVSVWKSQPFLLDKFIVATAFSLGVCLTVSLYLFAYKYLASGGRRPAFLAGLSMAGLVLYHTPAGIAATAATGLALAVCAVTAGPPLRRRAVIMLAGLGAAGILTLPYVFSVASGKESHQLIPLGISILKTSAVLISCAAALPLGLPWAIRFIRARRDPQYFYGLVVFASLLVSLLIVLPGPNVYDKPPYFAFIPLAPLAGWSLYAIYRRGRTPARRAIVVALCVLALAPNTVLLYAAYVVDVGPERVSPEELQLYEWIGNHTPRDAVFLENNDRVELVVTGPRRQLWGHDSYAYQWGYDGGEMKRRRALRDEVFSGDEMTQETVAALREYGDHVYIVVRAEDFSADEKNRFASSAFLTEVYSDSCASVYRVEAPR